MQQRTVESGDGDAHRARKGMAALLPHHITRPPPCQEDAFLAKNTFSVPAAPRILRRPSVAPALRPQRRCTAAHWLTLPFCPLMMRLIWQASARRTLADAAFFGRRQLTNPQEYGILRQLQMQHVPV